MDGLGDGEAEAGFGVEVEVHHFEGDGVLVAFPLVLGEAAREVGGPGADLLGVVVGVAKA